MVVLLYYSPFFLLKEFLIHKYDLIATIFAPLKDTEMSAKLVNVAGFKL